LEIETKIFGPKIKKRTNIFSILAKKKFFSNLLVFTLTIDFTIIKMILMVNCCFIYRLKTYRKTATFFPFK